MEDDLAVVHAGIAVPEARSAFPEGLDLRAFQDDARLEFLLDLVIVESLPVGRDRLFRALFRHGESTILRAATKGDSAGVRSAGACHTFRPPFLSF